MEDRARLLPDRVVERVGADRGADVGTRPDFLAHDLAKRRLRKYLLRQANAAAQRVEVVLAVENARLEPRRVFRISRLETETAAGFRTHGHRMNLDRVQRKRRLPGPARSEGSEIALDVGPPRSAGVDAGAGFEEIGHQQAPLQDEIVETVPEGRQSLVRAVKALRSGQPPRDRSADVILIIGADFGRIANQVDAMATQLVPRTDAGEHQQLRALKAAGGQDDALAGGDQHLAAVAAPRLDSRRPPVVYPDALDEQAGQERKVLAPELRFQEAMRRRLPLPAVSGYLIPADAFLGRAVEIVGGTDAGADRGLDDGFRDGVRRMQGVAKRMRNKCKNDVMRLLPCT